MKTWRGGARRLKTRLEASGYEGHLRGLSGSGVRRRGRRVTRPCGGGSWRSIIPRVRPPGRLWEPVEAHGDAASETAPDQAGQGAEARRSLDMCLVGCYARSAKRNPAGSWRRRSTDEVRTGDTSRQPIPGRGRRAQPDSMAQDERATTLAIDDVREGSARTLRLAPPQEWLPLLPGTLVSAQRSDGGRAHVSGVLSEEHTADLRSKSRRNASPARTRCWRLIELEARRPARASPTSGWPRVLGLSSRSERRVGSLLPLLGRILRGLLGECLLHGCGLRQIGRWRSRQRMDRSPGRSTAPRNS